MYQKDFLNSARRPPFTYRINPVHPRSFLVMHRDKPDAELEPYATYTVLDPSEDFALSEKKVINLVSLLNGRRAPQTGGGTDLRILYHMPERAAGADEVRTVILYALGKDGPSRENALIVLEKAEAIHHA